MYNYPIKIYEWKNVMEGNISNLFILFKFNLVGSSVFQNKG